VRTHTSEALRMARVNEGHTSVLPATCALSTNGIRRVAVYLETMQYRLEERFPPAYSTGDTTVYLFTDA